MSKVTIDISPNLVTLFASWKPKLISFAAAIYGVIQASGDHFTMGQLWHDPKLHAALFIAALAWITKPMGVTGGTTGVPSTAEALKDANQAPHPENPPKA